MSARTREEEYLRRMRALGYQDSLAGMDDENIEWELGKMEEADRRRETEWQQQPLRTIYRPVDPGLKARILRMFGQPHDESAIPEGQKVYLNGWDNGADEEYRLQKKPAQNLFVPSLDGTRRPEETLNYWDTALKRSSNGMGNWLQPMSETSGKDGDTSWWVDPKGMYPTDFLQNQSQVQQTTNEPATPKHPQVLWDEYIWNSPEVISAQTPHEKRAAVNKVIDERRGEFDAAYNAAYGDKSSSRWDNDRKFTLNAMGDYVSADQLKAFGWQNMDDKMVKDLNDALVKYEITTPARIRHFLAQAAKESELGGRTTERGSRQYFINNYRHHPSLGNTSDEDAVNFRGGGYIQLTGRNNYTNFRNEVNDEDVLAIGSEHVAKNYPWMASAYWWSKLNNMNDLVDKFDDLDTDADVERVTRKVNGEPDWDDPEDVEKWRASLKERQEHYRRSRGIF